MMPSIIYETLANDGTLAGMLGTTTPIADGTRILEVQSIDSRPDINAGYFIAIDFQETPMIRRRFGPQIMQIWVHTPLDWGRDYGAITRILNQIDKLIMPLENVTGNDGVRLTMIEQHGRSENTEDPGWKTATRNGLYGVLYNEAAA